MKSWRARLHAIPDGLIKFYSNHAPLGVRFGRVVRLGAERSAPFFNAFVSLDLCVQGDAEGGVEGLGVRIFEAGGAG